MSLRWPWSDGLPDFRTKKREENRDLKRSERRREMAQNRLPSPLDPSPFSYVVGIDIGSQKYSACVLQPDNRQDHKPRLFDNPEADFHRFQHQLDSLDLPAAEALLGVL